MAGGMHRPRWAAPLLLAGAALLVASFVANVALVEAATHPQGQSGGWGQNANLTYHFYDVAMQPGDVLRIVPNEYDGLLVELDIVEGGESWYYERGLRAPHVLYHRDPSDSPSRGASGALTFVRPPVSPSAEDLPPDLANVALTR